MPKIKVKKLVGLEELLDKIRNKEIEAKHYLGHNETDVYPGVEYLADFEIIDFVHGDSFEIEVEQEIDEDTKLEGLVEKFEDCNGYVDYTNSESSQSIKSALKLSKGVGATSLAFYLEQDNHELQLIWKEGEFVD